MSTPLGTTIERGRTTENNRKKNAQIDRAETVLKKIKADSRYPDVPVLCLKFSFKVILTKPNHHEVVKRPWIWPQLTEFASANIASKL